MAHFARVDGEHGLQYVREVIVVANAAINDAPFPESESLGQALLTESGFTGQWVQTSYNAAFRGKYAGVGDIWDGSNFITSEPTP